MKINYFTLLIEKKNYFKDIKEEYLTFFNQNQINYGIFYN